MVKNIYESLNSQIQVRKPHVGIPDVPLSPRTKEILEENDRIIKNQEETARRRRGLVGIR